MSFLHWPIEMEYNWVGGHLWLNILKPEENDGYFAEDILELAFLMKTLQFWTQSVTLQIFQNSYLSHGESLNHNISSHYYKTHMKHIFENITYITNKTPKLVDKILATNFGFVPDLLLEGAGHSIQYVIHHINNWWF